MANASSLLPGSPEWWLRRLHKKIVERRPTVLHLANYYDGNHNLAFASEKFLEAFGGLFKAFADNWCPLVVDAVEERLNVTGFRIPDDPTAKPTAAGVTPAGAAASKTAWSIWQANEMDAQAQIGHTEAILHGAAYACVWFGDDERMPDITVEHPVGAIVECDPKRKGLRLAGLRLYMDQLGIEHAELFLPDDVYLYRSPRPRDASVEPTSCQWIMDTDASPTDAPDGTMPNPLGVVPMVELPNRPRLWTPRGAKSLYYQSEIAAVIPLQDAANKLLADLLVSSEFAAYPQRTLTGYEAEIDPATNQPKPLPFKPGQKLWWLEDINAKFGTFPVADLSNYGGAIELIVGHIASITRTPPHYFNSSADRLSGESIKAAETGLVAKVHRKMQHFGEAWEEVMRLCGMIVKDSTLAAAEAAEVIWGDPETRTEAEHVDATVKLRALNLPDEFLWERLGLSPTEIARAKAMAAEKVLVDGAPEVPPVVTIRG